MATPAMNGHNGMGTKPDEGRKVPAGGGLLSDLVWFFLLAGALLTLSTLGEEPLGVEPGRPAPSDFRARLTFTSRDLEYTQMRRAAVVRAVPPVFRSRPDAWEHGVESTALWIGQGDEAAVREHLGSDTQAFLDLLPALQPRADQLRRALLPLGTLHWARPADLHDPLVAAKDTAEVVLLDQAGSETRAAAADLRPLDGGTGELEQAVAEPLAGLSLSEAGTARTALAGLLAPNATLDLEASERAAQRASAQVPTRIKVVPAGRIILSRGEEASRQQVEDLRSEREQFRQSRTGMIVQVERTAGAALLLLLLLAGSWLYVRRYRPEVLTRRMEMLSFALLTLALVGMARVCVTRGLPPVWVPVPLVVMVMCLVYDQRVGLAAAVLLSLLVRVAVPSGSAALAILLLGGVTTALLTRNVCARSALIKAGLGAGLVQAAAVWGLGLMTASDLTVLPAAFWRSPLLALSGAALANGLISGFIASGVLPAIEHLFGVTTDIRLLEWSDPNQPLLQKMLLEAPGTYHHSMLVGSLAADAAEAIGANALLARVSAYFHDVGKLKKPDYFAENVPEGSRNPHEDLTPAMSSLIIAAHPKDGAEMAEKHGVPGPVRDIILQSHGSTVLKYFWDKARNGENGQTQQGDFRYRLPKPQCREAAVVMLCDAVESAARSLAQPSPTELRDLVRGIILDRLHDGQLDESGLTVTDLKRLEDSLVHGVMAIFHSRVRYPGQEAPGEPGGESGSDSEETPANEGGDMQPAGRR